MSVRKQQISLQWFEEVNIVFRGILTPNWGEGSVTKQPQNVFITTQMQRGA
jgi:hypothetical protein